MDRQLKVSMQDPIWEILHRYVAVVNAKLARKGWPQTHLGAVVGAIVTHFLLREAARVTKEYAELQLSKIATGARWSGDDLSSTGLSDLVGACFDATGDSPTTSPGDVPATVGRGCEAPVPGQSGPPREVPGGRT